MLYKLLFASVSMLVRLLHLLLDSWAHVWTPWQSRPWHARIIDIEGLSPHEKGEAIKMIMLLPEGDRETSVPLDKSVALVSLKQSLQGASIDIGVVTGQRPHCLSFPSILNGCGPPCAPQEMPCMSGPVGMYPIASMHPFETYRYGGFISWVENTCMHCRFVESVPMRSCETLPMPHVASCIILHLTRDHIPSFPHSSLFEGQD